MQNHVPRFGKQGQLMLGQVHGWAWGAQLRPADWEVAKVTQMVGYGQSSRRVFTTVSGVHLHHSRLGAQKEPPQTPTLLGTPGGQSLPALCSTGNVSSHACSVTSRASHRTLSWEKPARLPHRMHPLPTEVPQKSRMQLFNAITDLERS